MSRCQNVGKRCKIGTSECITPIRFLPRGFKRATGRVEQIVQRHQVTQLHAWILCGLYETDAEIEALLKARNGS